MAEKEQNWETDIALIKSDIKQINRFFGKVEASIDMMSELSKNVAVQQEILKNTAEKLEDLEIRMDEHRKEDIARSAVISDRLEQYRISSREDHQRLSDISAANRAERNKEIMDALAKLNGSLDKRIADQEKRLGRLENWRYYMMGIGAAVLFVLARIQWPSLFG